MPGGRLRAFAGRHRNLYPVRIPKELPQLKAEQLDSGEVEIDWGLTKHTWGQVVSVYRGEKPDFAITDDNKIASTELGWYHDRTKLPEGRHYYAVVFDNGEARSKPFRVDVEVDAEKTANLSTSLPPLPGQLPRGKPVAFGKGLPKATPIGGAIIADEVLNTGPNGHVSYGKVLQLNIRPDVPLEVTFDAKFAEGSGTMPVLASAGQWRKSGWFVQAIGGRWRWHVDGVDCDGGTLPKPGTWTSLRCRWDGTHATLHQDGKEVATKPCKPTGVPWMGELLVGQYSANQGIQYQFDGAIKNLSITNE